MELKDFIVTPLVLIVVYTMSFFIKKHITDSTTSGYFFPALTVKIIGAIVLGVVYQFYYDQGDTFAFHTHGSRHIWEAFMDSPILGYRMLMGGADAPMEGIYTYTSKMPFFEQPSSHFVMSIAGILDLFTFSTYSGTAVLFATISFFGAWMFFVSFYNQYPHLHRGLAMAVLFVPSVCFWGSGILKDTVVLTGIYVIHYVLYRVLVQRKINLINVILFCLAFYAVFTVRKFMLQAYIPATLLWIFSGTISNMSFSSLKPILIPVAFILVAGGSYYLVSKIGEGDSRYALSKIAETSKITAYDIRYWTGKDAGSGYSLGALDGSYATMLTYIPSAINVSLFRPYLWEVKNPLMLLASIESLLLLIFTLYVIRKQGIKIFFLLTNRNIIYTLSFSLILAFAVGISTFNFGSLVRYKIPLLPFYLIMLTLMLNQHRTPNQSQ